MPAGSSVLEMLLHLANPDLALRHFELHLCKSFASAAVRTKAMDQSPRNDPRPD